MNFKTSERLLVLVIIRFLFLRNFDEDAAAQAILHDIQSGKVSQENDDMGNF